MKKPLLILTAFIFMLTACSNWPPAGFWTDYQKGYQVDKSSDQGPWGGTRIIHWKNEDGAFDKAEVIEFARENGWRLNRDTIYKTWVTQGWTYDSEKIFPIFEGDLKTSMALSCSCFKDLPRKIIGDITVMSFSTNYVSIDHESGDGVVTNGYIILSDTKKQMTLYHEWGE